MTKVTVSVSLPVCASHTILSLDWALARLMFERHTARSATQTGNSFLVYKSANMPVVLNSQISHSVIR